MKNAEPKNVLVTGAAGLIGSRVTQLLAARGVHVVACDNFSIGVWRKILSGVTWLEGDVADKVFYEQLSAHKVNGVIHCAAHPGGRSLKEPSDNVRVNALGSMRLFEWCARNRMHVIYTSSSAVYGNQSKRPIPETAALKPETIYAVCKVACERFLRILEEGFGLQWTVLRPFATYGAGHSPSVHQGIVNVMLTQLMAGNRVVVRGSLDRIRDLIDVNDTARAIVQCVFNPSTRGKTLNVGTGRGTSIRELIVLLSEVLGRPFEDIELVREAPTVGDPFYNTADVSLFEGLGFNAEVGLRKGLERLVEERKLCAAS